MNVVAVLTMHDFALGLHIACATGATCVKVEFAWDGGVGAPWAAQVSVDAVRGRRDATVRKTKTTRHKGNRIGNFGLQKNAELRQCTLMVAKQTKGKCNYEWLVTDGVAVHANVKRNTNAMW